MSVVDREEFEKVPITCPDCGGMGYVYEQEFDEVRPWQCSRCVGSGAIGYYTPKEETRRGV